MNRIAKENALVAMLCNFGDDDDGAPRRDSLTEEEADVIVRLACKLSETHTWVEQKRLLTAINKIIDDVL